MERLTKRIAGNVYYTNGKYDETIPAECEPHDVRKILQALADYEDTNHTPEECAAAFVERDNYKILRADADRIRESMMQENLMLIGEKTRLEKELAAYRAAEQDGTLVRVPCKVGDMVYVLIPADCGFCDKEQCENIFPCRKSYLVKTEFSADLADDVGKTVFLTREDAEAALKEQEEARAR